MRVRRWYMDHVYLPVYDLTVTRAPPYRRYLRHCLGKLSGGQWRTLLSVGVGTGTEVIELLREPGEGTAAGMSALATDVSQQGLIRARRKARRRDAPVQAARMDAQCLALAAGSFDRALCLHTMDFVRDRQAATKEILRVLKPGGEFVVTYPSGRGSIGLAGEVARSVVEHWRGRRLGTAFGEALAGAGAAAAYLPLALTGDGALPGLSRAEVEEIMTTQEISTYTLEEDPVYQDFIVWGKREPT